MYRYSYYKKRTQRIQWCNMETLNPKLVTYCTASDFLKATETISEDLAIVGLPPVVKYNDGDPVSTVVSLVNTVWTLLIQRQRLIDGKRDLEQKVRNLSEEMIYMKQKQRQLESALSRNEEVLNEKKKQLLINSQKEAESSKKIKSLKQELVEIDHNLKRKEWQFKHDFRRQQNEIATLQSKLREILSKKKGDKWKGPTDSSVESKSFTSKEDLLKKCICRLENNIQQLVKENLELRKLLDGVSSEMAVLLKTRQKQGINIT